MNMSELLDNKVGLVITLAAALIIGKLVIGARKSGAGRKVVRSMDATEYHPFYLKEKIPITVNTMFPVTLFRFELPAGKSLELPVGHHVRLRAQVDGKTVIRSYTPTSTNDDIGYFDLVVKMYPKGAMSNVFANLKIGDSIEMVKPKGRLTYVKNQWKDVGMVAGGTGITPMLQVVKEMLKHADDRTRVHLLFANNTFDDIILKDELDALAAAHADKFRVTYVLMTPPEGWTGATGFVTKDLMASSFAAPAPSTMVLMCGPPPMIAAMEKNLHELSYTDDMLFKF